MDISIIKQRYAAMNDAAIQAFAKTDGKGITNEALQALEAEFIKRNLDTSVIESIYAHKPIQQIQEIEKLKQENKNDDLTETIWQYALDKKFEGLTNDELKSGLLKFNLSGADADYIINFLPKKAADVADKYQSRMMWFALVFILGIMVTVLSYVAALGGGTFLFAYGAVIFGPVAFFSSLSKRAKCLTVLRNLKAEENI